MAVQFYTQTNWIVYTLNSSEEAGWDVDYHLPCHGWKTGSNQWLPCMLKPTSVHNPWIKWSSICIETTDSDIYLWNRSDYLWSPLQCKFCEIAATICCLGNNDERKIVQIQYTHFPDIFNFSGSWLRTQNPQIQRVTFYLKKIVSKTPLSLSISKMLWVEKKGSHF